MRFTGLWVLTILLSFSISQASSKPVCVDLFLRPSAPSRLDPFEAVFDALRNMRPASISIINQNIILIAKDPSQHSKIERLLRDLDVLSAKITAGDQSKGPSYYTVNAQSRRVFLEIIFFTQSLLRLVQDSNLGLWKEILSNEKKLRKFNEFNTFGLMGHLLRLLPVEKKNELLLYLGGVYSRTNKNRAVLQPIHVMLNPKEIYDRFKSAGKSDREFYIYYLEQISTKVFAGRSAGNYSGELVIQIAKLIQKTLIKDEVEAVNFFGSVPNGFGKSNSDLDIFNHPIIPAGLVKTPKDRQEVADIFDYDRYAVVDKSFNRAVRELLRGTRWKWKVIEGGQNPPEDFGGRRHVFSFHITEDKIVVRFYYNSIRLDEQARPLPEGMDFIELDMSSDTAASNP